MYRFDGNEPMIGAGSYVSELAMVIGNVIIAENSYIGHGAILRGDYGKIIIGSGTAVEEGTVVHAPPQGVCLIGNHVTLGHGAIIHCDEIEDYAVIGMGAVISMHAKVGTWAIVAEGGVVKARQVVPARIVAAGSPAEFVRDVEDRDMEFWTWGKQIYVDLAAKCLKEGMMERIDK